HFTLGYVLRYVGLRAESTHECENALALDRGNYYWRSCAWAFMQLGNTQRARDFVQLDAGSEWTTYAMPFLFLREGKVAEAREAVKKMSFNPQDFRNLLQGCLVGPPVAFQSTDDKIVNCFTFFIDLSTCWSAEPSRNRMCFS